MFAVFGDLLGRSGVGIGATCGNELLRPGVIDLATFGLKIRHGGTIYDRAFCPVETEPFESVDDEIGGACYKAGLVGVFDAENEVALGLFGDEVGVDGATDVADVDIAGRAGGETSFYLIRHGEIII